MYLGNPRGLLSAWPRPSRDPRSALGAFGLEVDGNEAEFDNVTACEGLDAHYDVYQFSEGGAASGHRLPTGIGSTNVRISRPSTTRAQPWPVVREVRRARPHRRRGDRCRGKDDEAVVAQWNLRGVWPVRYSGPKFSSAGTAAAIETIELAHLGFHGEV